MKDVSKNEDRLYRMVAEVLGVGPDTLSEESSPDNLAGWDSLNHLNLVMALESEFRVRLSIEATLGMRNVGFMRTILRDYGVEV